MSKRNFKVYLDDILKSIEKIEVYIKGLTFNEFSAKSIAVDAVLRNLEIIGEAVKNLPKEVTETYKEIEWKKIAGFRDIAIHAYSDVDLEIVWDILENKLLQLKNSINKIVKLTNKNK